MAEITAEPEGKAPWSRDRSIGHYGAAFDKGDSQAESLVPYAYAWYRVIQSGRGSGYSQDASGLVYAENLALARSEAARTRAAEKLTANSIPVSADEKLDNWVDVLKVTRLEDDSIQDLRARCAAKGKAAIGPTIANVDEALDTLLGEAFVRTWRQEGADLATPPTQTYWPGINPGLASYDLGGGAWLSERCHYVVEVVQPPGMTLAKFVELVDVHMFQLLDRFLPSWATFSWGIDLTDGFLLDLDDLDFHALIP